MSDPVTITPSSPVTVTIATVGPQGPKGEPGISGGGVPTGGATGQVLMKMNTEDFASTWANVPQPEEIDGGTF